MSAFTVNTLVSRHFPVPVLYVVLLALLPCISLAIALTILFTARARARASLDPGSDGPRRTDDDEGQFALPPPSHVPLHDMSPGIRQHAGPFDTLDLSDEKTLNGEDARNTLPELMRTGGSPKMRRSLWSALAGYRPQADVEAGRGAGSFASQQAGSSSASSRAVKSTTTPTASRFMAASPVHFTIASPRTMSASTSASSLLSADLEAPVNHHNGASASESTTSLSNFKALSSVFADHDVSRSAPATPSLASDDSDSDSESAPSSPTWNTQATPRDSMIESAVVVPSAKMHGEGRAATEVQVFRCAMTDVAFPLGLGLGLGSVLDFKHKSSKAAYVSQDVAFTLGLGLFSIDHDCFANVGASPAPLPSAPAPTSANGNTWNTNANKGATSGALLPSASLATSGSCTSFVTASSSSSGTGADAELALALADERVLGSADLPPTPSSSTYGRDATPRKPTATRRLSELLDALATSFSFASDSVALSESGLDDAGWTADVSWSSEEANDGRKEVYAAL
ncbi:uncharacterized protein BXZ73DRAFT_106634 [Epithele typhae]|uniref:uncharacterized protein n=1 Tax=Epithele typhae TaxID=378194 RepID=UPI002008AD7E|nr:uncharacterized protein BXZ73DRAFT_106634 [Epithele typhae]KAH9914392.1 hypothetical protein BXZ73DRAFT_106634 [Epithele typhae]